MASRARAAAVVRACRSCSILQFRSLDYWLLPELTTHLGFLLALVFLAYLIRQKRSPASTMAWLLLVLFLPYVGVPLYLMFGGRKMSRMARKKAQVYEPASSPPRSRPRADARAVAPVLRRASGRGGNRVELLTRGEEAFRHLVRAHRRGPDESSTSRRTSSAATPWARSSWSGWPDEAVARA